MTIPKGLSKFYKQANSYLKNPKKLKRLLDAVIDYASKNKKEIKKLLKDLKTLVEMLRCWIKGEYKEIPTDSILLIILALLYFLSPIDLIPDFLPGGFIDDAAVIAWVIQSIKNDIEKFKKWKKFKT